jgi:quinohemoprotein ethanol dehydrogenase
VVQEFPKPPLPRQPAALAKKGEVYFEAEWCVGCHGHAVENVRSSIPDLRLATAQTHAQFAAIVLGGARRDKGMPSFPTIRPDELAALQAYVLNEAWSAYEAQEAARPQAGQRGSR